MNDLISRAAAIDGKMSIQCANGACCGIEMENDLDMTDKDKEATDKLNRWLEDIGLSEECEKDYCEIETKEDGELKELIKEQHRNE